MAFIINHRNCNSRISIIKSITQKLSIIIKNSIIFLSIFTLLISQCVSTATATTTTTNKSSKSITPNNSSINFSNLIRSSQNQVTSSILLVNDSNNINNNSKSNINYNNDIINISNRNSKSFNDDYLSVDNFRRNIEHKSPLNDNIDNDDDDDDDYVQISNTNDSIDLVNSDKNENQKLIYHIINPNDISISNKDNQNITLKFYDLKQILNSSDSDIKQSNIIDLNSSELNLFNNSKREIRAVRRSICEIGCKCEKDNAFLIVICDFVENRSMDSVFGSKIEIPTKTKSFIAKLNRDTRFRIDEGLFEDNVINNIRIEGIQDGDAQIEISRNSFKGNYGPYPEITIIDVQTVILRSNSFSGEFRLAVKNSDYVKIYENAFHNTSFEGHFTNIEDLRFDVGAFNKAQAKLLIEDSKIELLSRFEASLREIKFNNCTIGTIDTGAFDVNNINSIVFYRCKIDVFRTKAITEKLLSHNFSITNGDIRIMESEAISGSGITELVLKNNNIDEIQSNAIYVIAANATISHNSINKLGDKWLRIKDFTYIHINQNQFGDFGSMLLEQPPTVPNTVFCKFENNTITNPKPGSLNIPNKYCIIREISFYRLCSCNTSWLEEITTRDLRSLSYCRVDTNLMFCLKRPVYNILAWINEVCNYESSKLDCMKGLKQKDVNSQFIQPNDNDGFNVNWIYIIVGGIILVTLIITVFITSMKCYRKRQQQQQQQAATHLSESNSAGSNLTPNGTAQKHQHVFSNDDRRIINQTIELLRQRYALDIYDEVNKNTQILLRGNITEMQRVKAIGDIVQALDECQNTGDDFVAFTDILYKHLASSSGTAPPIEPTYSEPVLQDDNNSGGGESIGVSYSGRTGNNNRGIGPYASTAVGSVPGITDVQTNIDHIYAEPTSAQQPLLTNEYASPADRSDDNMVDLYSEPISNDRDRKIIPPYAVIGPKQYPTTQSTASVKHQQKKQQQPSSTILPTSQNINQKNLPDVLHPSTSSSMSNNSNNNINNNHNISNNSNNNINNSNSSSFKPLTNVQKMAKSFANDPSFHITRSPTSNRRIPKYTIPNKRHPSDIISSLDNNHHQQPSTSTSINNPTSPSIYSSQQYNKQDYDSGNFVVGLGAGSGNLVGNFNNLNINLSPTGETATATTSSDNQSNHSGGSDVTVQMDEIIEYVDA